jgi:hypothetical protein
MLGNSGIFLESVEWGDASKQAGKKRVGKKKVGKQKVGKKVGTKKATGNLG